MTNKSEKNQDLTDPKQLKVEKLISGIFFAFITSIGVLSGYLY
jgi:hypothetical protein